MLTRLSNAHTQVYFSRSGPPNDGAIAGPLNDMALRRLPLPVDSTLYTCGPQAFMDGIARAAGPWGLPMCAKLFGSRDAINPGIVGASPIHHPQAPDGAPGDGPLVTFSRSGLIAPWAGQRYARLLEFAEACDVSTRWACRSGVCHVCSTPTVSGAVRYVNDPPVPPPAGEVLLCSCEPDGPIVLDMWLVPTVERRSRDADRLSTYSDAVFAVIVTIMVLQLNVPDRPICPTDQIVAADRDLPRQLRLHRHHLDQPPPPITTDTSHHPAHHLDQLRTPLFRVAAAVHHRLDRTYQTRRNPSRHVCGTVRLR